MTNPQDSKTPPSTAGNFAEPGVPLLVVLVALAAMLGRLPALGAYWNQDDWGLLAAARGLESAPTPSMRWLSQVVYWRLLEPLAGLDAQPYAWSRILLHALAAVGVLRLGSRLGLSTLQATLAGLVMAATPLAFTPLYWAAGVQDLLAVAAAVWSLNFWLREGRWAPWLSLALGVAAIMSKEAVAGLPVVMGLLVWLRLRSRPGRIDLLAMASTTAASVFALVLAWRGFGTGADAPYALGPAWVMLANLPIYGWWLLQPGPSFTPSPAVWQQLVGGLLWLAWLGWGLWRSRLGHRWVLVTWLGALLMIAPLLPLRQHLAPDLAYPVEPFGCLALASLVPARWRAVSWRVYAAVATAIVWGFLGMEGRLALRGRDGLPDDPVVRRTAASWHASRSLARLPLGDRPLVIVQPPLLAETAGLADRLGEDWVTGSVLYHALDGALGPRLLLGDRNEVQWTNGLRLTPAEALVLVDAGADWKPWGFTPTALLYMALTDVGLGHFERARKHLLRSSLLTGDQVGFLFDPDQMIVPLARVIANEGPFLGYLESGRERGRSPLEIAGLQLNFQRLLDACTGREPTAPVEPTERTTP